MTDVVMPQMGESIVEGTLTKWLKKPGEHVERDEPLFEISTDKVDTEIPSPAAGTLSEVLVEEGKTVGINTVVARISEGDGAAPAAKPAAGPSGSSGGSETEAAQPQRPAGSRTAAGCRQPAGLPAPQLRRRSSCRERRRAGRAAGPLSPLVRRMARENNIDLSTGEGHRRGRTHHQAGCGGATWRSARRRPRRRLRAAAAAPRRGRPPPRPRRHLRPRGPATAPDRPRRASSR